ncbi:MAG: histidine kinase dimerization/phospho-acceptor domain-containing protein [Rhizomicrobium sp.]
MHLEADKLRVAMLTSLSHDLRTPLASILGAATTLLTDRELYDAAQTHELLSTIRDEAERLDRFVGNLLDMSRLEAGALGVKPETADVKELVDVARKRLARRLGAHRLVLDIPGDLPAVLVDPLLVEQALVNLLDNAAKYSSEGSAIRVAARRPAIACASRSRTRGRASRPMRCRTSSTSSTAPRPPTAGSPAPVSAWLWRAASWRLSAAPSTPPIAATPAAPF